MPSGFQDPSCRVSNLFGRKRRGRIVLPALLLETNVHLNFGSFEQCWGRIRIRMFLGLQDPDQDPLVTSADPDPASSFF